MDSIIERVDSISSMPDVILHHILSFVPFGLAIRTSTLSKRWRHVWCEVPCLDFSPYARTLTARDINQTLISYRALKIKEFHLGKLHDSYPGSVLERWIEFAMSRNVEKLSLMIRSCCVDDETYRFPDLFCHSFSLENLTLDVDMIPRCAVSWTCLRTLTLSDSFQPVADVLSGCPVLETLTLLYYRGVQCLDLSKSPTLTTLTITRWKSRTPGSMEIVAPHLRNLNLATTDEPCTLVDVSSLAQCRLGISLDVDDEIDLLQLENIMRKMLAKVQNVEELTFDAAFLQILSLAQLRDVPFPTLKVQTMTLYTMFAIYVIPGIVKLLQNSPGLKKLVVHVTDPKCIQQNWDLESNLYSQGLTWNQCLRSKYEGFPSSIAFRHEKANLILGLSASFIEMVMKNVEALETLVLGFKYVSISHDAKWFEELLQMLPTLSNNKNVSIVLRR